MNNSGGELDGVSGEEGSSLELESSEDKGSSVLTESIAEKQVAERPSGSVSPHATEIKHEGKSKAWVHYVPLHVHKYRDSLPERMEEHLENINDCLAVKEEFNLAFIDQNLHRSYYRMWVHDSNSIFRCAVRLKHRIAKLEKSK